MWTVQRRPAVSDAASRSVLRMTEQATRRFRSPNHLSAGQASLRGDARPSPDPAHMKPGCIGPVAPAKPPFPRLRGKKGGRRQASRRVSASGRPHRGISGTSAVRIDGPPCPLETRQLEPRSIRSHPGPTLSQENGPRRAHRREHRLRISCQALSRLPPHLPADSRQGRPASPPAASTRTAVQRARAVPHLAG